MSHVPSITWESRVVASVAKHLRAGKSFDRAWTLMLDEVPIPHTGHGVGPAKLFVVAGDDPEELPLLDAMRSYCADAVYGRKPHLAGFDLAMLRGGDSSGPASRAGMIRQAA